MALKSVNGVAVSDGSDYIRLHYDSGTGEYGLQIKLVNDTGGNTVKGYIVGPSSSVTGAFVNHPVNEPDILGVIYEANVANGQSAWVWIQGKVQVYYIGNTARDNFARGTATGDSDTTAGRAVAESAPTSPFATDKHFQEIGHVVEARTGAGLALTIIHFN